MIPARYGVLMIGLAITGLYNFAASLIFPSALAAGLDLNSWYFDHKSTVFVILLACPLLAHGSKYALVGEAGYQWSWVVRIEFAVFLAAQAAVIFARGFRRNLTLLVVMIALYLVVGIRNLS